MMRLVLFRAAAAALFLFLAAVAARGEETGEAFLARVAKKYGSARSLSARFRQEVPLQNVGIVRKASGTLFVARPLKMRWDYRAPDNQIFLADGDHYYFRPTGSPQVFRRRIDEKALGGKIPLLLLFGKGEITDLFRVEEADRRQGGEVVALRLLPKGDGAPDVKRVDLVVGTGDLLIREVHLYDRVGGANHLYLEGTTMNPVLPADTFRFRKPAGVEVVDG